jgi:hypothetical protein
MAQGNLHAFSLLHRNDAELLFSQPYIYWAGDFSVRGCRSEITPAKALQPAMKYQPRWNPANPSDEV